MTEETAKTAIKNILGESLLSCPLSKDMYQWIDKYFVWKILVSKKHTTANQ